MGASSFFRGILNAFNSRRIRGRAWNRKGRTGSQSFNIYKTIWGRQWKAPEDAGIGLLVESR